MSCDFGICTLKDTKCHACRTVDMDRSELLGHLWLVTKDPNVIIEHKDDSPRSLCGLVAELQRKKYPQGTFCEIGRVTTPIVTLKVLAKAIQEAEEILRLPPSQVPRQVPIFEKPERQIRPTKDAPYWEQEPSEVIHIIASSISQNPKNGSWYLIAYDKESQCYFSITLRKARKETKTTKPGSTMIFKVRAEDRGVIYNWAFKEFSASEWEEDPAEALISQMKSKMRAGFKARQMNPILLQSVANLASAWALTHEDYATKIKTIDSLLLQLPQENKRLNAAIAELKTKSESPARATELAELTKQLLDNNKFLRQAPKQRDILTNLQAKKGGAAFCGHPPPAPPDVAFVPAGCRSIFENDWEECLDWSRGRFKGKINAFGNWRTPTLDLCDPSVDPQCTNLCQADELERVCKATGTISEQDKLIADLDVAFPDLVSKPEEPKTSLFKPEIRRAPSIPEVRRAPSIPKTQVVDVIKEIDEIAAQPSEEVDFDTLMALMES